MRAPPTSYSRALPSVVPPAAQVGWKPGSITFHVALFYMNFEGEGIIITSILQMSKLRLEEIRNLPRFFSSQVSDRA